MKNILVIFLLVCMAVGIASAKPAYLVSATQSNNGLVLKFNQKVSSADVKIFSLNEKPNYRNIADIKAIINGKPIRIKNFMAEEIVIAQNNPETIRVVARSKSQKNLRVKFNGNSIILTLEDFIAKEGVNKGIGSQTSQTKQTNQASKTQTNSTKQTATKQTNTKKNEPKTQTNQSKSQAATRPNIGSKVIVIDPGHGGKDPGAVNGKLQEKKAVLDVGKKLGAELKKRGYKVYFTREKDVFINLRGRTKIANDRNADLFISLHANAAPNAEKAKTMSGVETFFLSPARSERSKNAAALENKSDIEEMNYFSKQTFLNFLNREKIIASNKLAIDVHAGMLNGSKASKFSVVDGGVREAPFWVLVGALMPSVLIEIGYITHPTESKRLFDEKYQNALAKGIADGIDGYFIKNR